MIWKQETALAAEPSNPVYAAGLDDAVDSVRYGRFYRNEVRN